MKGKMRILIAYDGSKCADAALADLRRAGLPTQAQAHVVSVYAEWMPASFSYEIAASESSGYVCLEEEKDALERARHAVRVVKSSFPEWAIDAMAYVGSPAAVILHCADELKTHLIVLGSHGRSGFARLLLGSVSQKVLHAAHCNVRIARGRPEKSPSPIRLIVGVDGSAGADAAVRAIAKRHWPQDSEARIVNAPFILPPSTANYAVSETVKQLATENAKVEQAIETAAGKLRGAGLSVSTIAKKEDVRQLLISEADAWRADCIFLGARGLGALSRFMLGSVSSAVSAHANCSVEVVREEE